MNPALDKPKRASARKQLHRKLSDRLSGLLTQRDLGLITQREFEDELDQVLLSYPRAGSLTETALSMGGTRFVFREVSTCEILAQFEFRRVYRADI